MLVGVVAAWLRFVLVAVVGVVVGLVGRVVDGWIGAALGVHLAQELLVAEGRGSRGLGHGALVSGW